MRAQAMSAANPPSRRKAGRPTVLASASNAASSIAAVAVGLPAKPREPCVDRLQVRDRNADHTRGEHLLSHAGRAAERLAIDRRARNAFGHARDPVLSHHFRGARCSAELRAPVDSLITCAKGRLNGVAAMERIFIARGTTADGRRPGGRGRTRR